MRKLTLGFLALLIAGIAMAAEKTPPTAPPVKSAAAAKSAKPKTEEDLENELKTVDETKMNKADAEFRKKLASMLDKTEKSLKIIREQIVQNQSAPFLADLYMQLGDLLTEKSTVLYYLQMQGDNRTENKIAATQKFSPVVVTAQEAITIYEQILKEFPKFDKRDKILYRLAVSQKSIDESAAFVKTAEQLIKDYPNTKETIQVRLLLGQHYFDMQALEDSLTQLNIVKATTYPYERNAAKYRIGLIDILKEKHADALKMLRSRRNG